MKPRLFIASSSEGLEIANAIHANLQQYAEVTVWNQAIFALSRTALQSLVTALPNFDFGAFVFSPDDLTTIRGESERTVRDNVIFELGLFTGRLGQDRCFIVAPHEDGDLRFPTDLLGLVPARYESSRSDRNVVAATGPAAQTIRVHMESRGLLPTAAGQSEGAKPPKAISLENHDSKSEDPAPQEKPSIAGDVNPLVPWVEAFLGHRYLEAAQLLESLVHRNS